jgi:hypothetical protein
MRFVRPRVFIPGRNESKWWLTSIPGTLPVDAQIEAAAELADEAGRAPPRTVADGKEFVEVVEVVHTDAVGKLALYRQWVEDPDGTEVTVQWAKKRKQIAFRVEHRLRGTLATMGFELEGPALRSIVGGRAL